MRALVLALMIALTSVPASAQAVIGPCDAPNHIREKVTVEGTVEQVNASASTTAFINMCGKFPKNTFQAVIFARDAGKFPNISTLEGKTVEITGVVKAYKQRAEIFLDDPAQLKVK
jgi:DNA/RNA endonuclease YhcR with UshA esterase domain